MEGAVVGILLTTAVAVFAFLFGWEGVLSQPWLPFILVGVGALGMVLTGRLSLSTFDDRS